MSRQPRFEIVHSDAGWHARFRAANGRIVWTTENYVRRRGAFDAVEAISSGFITRGVDKRYRVRQRDDIVLEVRIIDERAS